MPEWTEILGDHIHGDACESCAPSEVTSMQWAECDSDGCPNPSTTGVCDECRVAALLAKPRRARQPEEQP